MDFLILVINPGSTSTKIALYRNEEAVFSESIEHSDKELDQFESILQQAPMRKKLVVEALIRHGYKPEDLSLVMGRGGLLPPIKTGGYRVNEVMLDLIYNEKIQEHASNLGAVLASDIAKTSGVEAYIYDAVSASDFPPVAKITGMREVLRNSFYHVLNSRSAALRFATSQGKRYEDMNLIVAHLGGGITIGVHCKGKIIDSLSDDNGPFAPERSGSVPLLDIIEMCYNGNYTKQEMIKRVRGKGGLRDLLGTSDFREIRKRIEAGDEYARLVMEAQCYQVAKGIALLTPALKGKCDAIILTGGLAYDDSFIEKTKEYIDWYAPIATMPGEYEMEALAFGGLRILNKQESVNEM